jgi:hypothetical protein
VSTEAKPFFISISLIPVAKSRPKTLAYMAAS